MPPTTPAALLIINGELPSTPLIARLAGEAEIVVATDGAGLRLIERGIVPDVVIGDLDSLGARRAMLPASVSVLERPSQEENDFEKGLRWLMERGSREVTVIGHAGGMIDHTLNNFSIVARYASKVILRLVDDSSIGYVVERKLALDTLPGQRISLIPLPSARLTTAGLRWELREEMLALGAREGASNAATGTSVLVTIAEGRVILFHYHSGAL